MEAFVQALFPLVALGKEIYSHPIFSSLVVKFLRGW